jgi:hypothetical protein
MSLTVSIIIITYYLFIFVLISLIGPRLQGKIVLVQGGTIYSLSGIEYSLPVVLSGSFSFRFRPKTDTYSIG